MHTCNDLQRPRRHQRVLTLRMMSSSSLHPSADTCSRTWHQRLRGTQPYMCPSELRNNDDGRPLRELAVLIKVSVPFSLVKGLGQIDLHGDAAVNDDVRRERICLQKERHRLDKPAFASFVNNFIKRRFQHTQVSQRERKRGTFLSDSRRLL